MNKNKVVKKQRARPKSAMKTINQVVKKALAKEVETKQLNVPNPSGLANNNNVAYNSGSGVQYLVIDVYKQGQGTADSTVLGNPTRNRIGDRVRAVGFLMDYYFTTNTSYNVGVNLFPIPYVKLRITVFRQAFGTPLLPLPLLYDTNFNNVNTSTLQPINWDEGYVKDVLYDKVHIIESNYQQLNTVSPNVSILPLNKCFHFKKYFKFDRVIKYCDNNTTSPNSTDLPINIVISAEIDDATAFTPSGTLLLSSTGFTKAWFKDA